MSCYQRPNSTKWRVVRRGSGISQTFDTEREARAFEATEIERLRGGIQYQAKLSKKIRVGDVLEKFRIEEVPKRGGAKWDNNRLVAMQQLPFAQLRLNDDIHAGLILWRDERLKEVASGTVIRDLALLGSVFNKAMKEWKLLSHNPAHMVIAPASDDEMREYIWSDEEVRIFCEYLHWNPDISPAEIATLAGVSRSDAVYGYLGWTIMLLRHIGLRLGNTVSLQLGWIKLSQRQILFPRRLGARKEKEDAVEIKNKRVRARDEAAGKAVLKNGKGFKCPLNAKACELLGKLVDWRLKELETLGLNAEQIAVQPLIPADVSSIGALLRRQQQALAASRPDIPGYAVYTRHDLRHTFTTELAKLPGMTLARLMKLTGRSDTKSLLRYINEDVSDMIDLMDGTPAPVASAPVANEVSELREQLAMLTKLILGGQAAPALTLVKKEAA